MGNRFDARKSRQVGERQHTGRFVFCDATGFHGGLIAVPIIRTKRALFAHCHLCGGRRFIMARKTILHLWKPEWHMTAEDAVKAGAIQVLPG